MSTAETIALIRDISIIVASGIVALVFLLVGFILLRVYLQLYLTLRRAARKFEQSSDIILNVVSQPLNLASAIVDLVSRVLGVVEQFRNKYRRKDDDEDQ
jgi:hypothetical protein